LIKLHDVPVINVLSGMN